MSKFFVKNNQIFDYQNEIDIIDEDVNHIKKVLRKNIGDELNICNTDSGDNYIVKIKSFEKDKIICSIEEKVVSENESNVKISLFQGLPKFDKMEYIIQKNTEVGVYDFFPIIMKRTIVKVREEDKEKRNIRFKKTAESAAKQSLRDIIPEIHNIVNFSSILESLEQYDLVLVAYEDEENNSLKSVLRNIEEKNDYKIAVLIGPEGGIDKEEIDELKKLDNVKIVSLGKRILRTETAGIVINSQIMYELSKN